MNREMTLTHEFVEYIPNKLKEKTIYVSIAFATAVHKCCCGCGNEVVTPLTPTDWALTFDGESISLEPSIGNWSFNCQSHYWIKRNKVIWAPRWTKQQIDAGRRLDRRAKEQYYDSNTGLQVKKANLHTSSHQESEPKESLWERLKKWLRL